MNPPRIFISYSHQDFVVKERLTTQLQTLALEGIFERVWDDSKIPDGVEWQQEIEKALAECDVAILLISAPFLISRFIHTKELPELLEKRKKQGMRLYLLLVGACPWEEIKWLAALNLRTNHGNPIPSGENGDPFLAALTKDIAREFKAAKALAVAAGANGSTSDTPAPAEALEKETGKAGIPAPHLRSMRNLALLVAAAMICLLAIGVALWYGLRQPVISTQQLDDAFSTRDDLDQRWNAPPAWKLVNGRTLHEYDRIPPQALEVTGSDIGSIKPANGDEFGNFRAVFKLTMRDGQTNAVWYLRWRKGRFYRVEFERPTPDRAASLMCWRSDRTQALKPEEPEWQSLYKTVRGWGRALGYGHGQGRGASAQTRVDLRIETSALAS